MNSPSSFCYHGLPKDLARLILETLVDLDRRDAAKYALISKEVKRWIEPILYRNIKITHLFALHHLHDLVTDPASTKPTNFFATHVKTIIFTEMEPMNRVLGILRACRPGLQSLALCDSLCTEYSLVKLRQEFQLSGTSSPTLGQEVAFPKLRQFSLASDYLHTGQRNFSHPLFKNLTHLEAIFDDWFPPNDADPREWDWKTGLSQLEHLTHLRVSCPILGHSTLAHGIKDILSHCPASLQVFISWIEGIHPQEAVASTGYNQIEAFQRGDLDVRVVFAFDKDENWSTSYDTEGGPHEDIESRVVICSDRDREQEWNGVEFEKTIWRRAEEVIEWRRSRLERDDSLHMK